MSKKKIMLLGASGSIGTQTLDIISQHTDQFELIGLSVGKRVNVLKQYLDQNKLKYGCTAFKMDAEQLSEMYPQTTFYYGDEGLKEMAAKTEFDLLFNAIQGFTGLQPTLTALENGKDVAIANKESLVAAGDIVMQTAKEHQANVIPVDSEHSAIFQTLQGYQKDDIKRLIITASGGAFKNLNRQQLENVTKQDALKHPRWNMGAKITIDSATMMNKGFEIIEAHVLFDLPYEQIDTVIHPESIVHSMTEFKDHCVLAQLGCADMRMPIQFALSYPHRIENSCDTLDLAALGSLNFAPMDTERFPLVALAYEVGKRGGNLPAVLNGANEAVVDLFLEDKCRFLDIEKINFEVVKQAEDIFVENPSLDEIVFANDWATRKVHELMKV